MHTDSFLRISRLLAAASRLFALDSSRSSTMDDRSPHSSHLALVACACLLAGCSGSSATPDDAHGAMHEEETVAQRDEEHDRSHQGENHHHRHRFDEPERYAKRWNDPARDEWQRPEVVLEQLAIEPGATVVDLGTGTGYFVPHLAEAVGPKGSVLALDIEPAMVDYVRENAAKDLPQVEVRQIERAGPGLDAASVDRILVVNVWHHLDERVDYARGLLDDLAPGGRLVVVDYREGGDFPGPPERMRLTPTAIAGELERAGFETRTPEVDLPRQYIVVGVKPRAKEKQPGQESDAN
jgi:SAM-dependent methyltransferase